MVFFIKFLVDCFCTRHEDNLRDPHSYGKTLIWSCLGVKVKGIQSLIYIFSYPLTLFTINQDFLGWDLVVISQCALN